MLVDMRLVPLEFYLYGSDDSDKVEEHQYGNATQSITGTRRNATQLLTEATLNVTQSLSATTINVTQSLALTSINSRCENPICIVKENMFNRETETKLVVDRRTPFNSLHFSPNKVSAWAMPRIFGYAGIQISSCYCCNDPPLFRSSCLVVSDE
jgi:hypothetical protein